MSAQKNASRTASPVVAAPSAAPAAASASGWTTAPGRFGQFGGRFVSETLLPSLDELDRGWSAARVDPAFKAELARLLRDYVGRPTPLSFAGRLSAELGGGARIYLKREDLCHTGAHKINNCIGQVLLAERMGKTRIIAETGAGQHGVATATACALFGLPCEIYMGADRRRAPGAERLPHEAARGPGPRGQRRDRDAEGRHERGAARLGHQRAHDPLRDRLGRRSAPVPDAGARAAGGHRPRGAPADPGGRGSSARRAASPASAAARTRSGSFTRSSTTPACASSASRPRGRASTPAITPRRCRAGRVGILHGARSYVLCDDEGQISRRTRSPPASTTPASGPSTASSRTRAARATSRSPTPRRWAASSSSRAPRGSCRALESSHAIAALPRVLAELPENAVVVVNLSGRGDKDMGTLAKAPGVTL